MQRNQNNDRTKESAGREGERRKEGEREEREGEGVRERKRENSLHFARL